MKQGGGIRVTHLYHIFEIFVLFLEYYLLKLLISLTTLGVRF